MLTIGLPKCRDFSLGFALVSSGVVGDGCGCRALAVALCCSGSSYAQYQVSNVDEGRGYTDVRHNTQYRSGSGARSGRVYTAVSSQQ